MVSVANKTMRVSYMRKNLEEIKFDVWYFRVPFDYATNRPNRLILIIVRKHKGKKPQIKDRKEDN